MVSWEQTEVTELRFLEILAKYEPKLGEVPPTTPLHSLAFLVVADRWIKEIPDDSDSKLLRDELCYFLEQGKFSWM